MKWTLIDKDHVLYQQGYRHGTMFNILDMDKYYGMVAIIEATGTYIGTFNYNIIGHYKTERLAQRAVERAILKKYFKYSWHFENGFKIGTLDVDFSHLYKDRLHLSTRACSKGTMMKVLSDAKKDFLNQI